MSRGLSVNIDMGNDAFADGNAGAEVARILRVLASRLEESLDNDCQHITLRDINGNNVGVCEVGAGDDDDN